MHPRKFIVAHHNNNSLKTKFEEIHELLNKKIVDLLFISDTKLDTTYRDSLLKFLDTNLKGVTVTSMVKALQLL